MIHVTQDFVFMTGIVHMTGIVEIQGDVWKFSLFAKLSQAPAGSPSWAAAAQLAELSLILHFTDHPPTPPCQ